jgi:hypothetical protein
MRSEDRPRMIHPTKDKALPTKGIGGGLSCEGQKSRALSGVPSGGQFIGLGPQAATQPGLSGKVGEMGNSKIIY